MKKLTAVLVVVMVGVVVLPRAGWCDDRPVKDEKKKTERANRARNLGSLDDMTFTVKIPKPEALIFEKRQRARYAPRSDRKSFTHEIIRSGREL